MLHSDLPDDLLDKVGHSPNATFALESSIGWLRHAGYRIVKLELAHMQPATASSLPERRFWTVESELLP